MANPIDLIITKQALEVVDSAIAKVNLLDKTMQEATQHFIDNSKKMASATPSGVAGNAENNAAITAQLKTQADTIAKLSAELVNLNDKLTKLNTTKSATKKLTADEIVQNQAERKAAIELAKANSALIGSYEKLNIRHQQAVRNAQNLGATYGVASKQFKKAADEANILDKELKELDSTLGKNQRNVGNYTKSFNSLGATLGAIGITTGVAGVVALGTNIFNTTKEIISLDNALKLVTETQSNFTEQQEFLSRISEAYGADINDLTKNFTQFYVSAKDKISGKEIQGIFESITKAGAAMGLSTQQQERAFLALNQMMSKGTVQAEELRGQLAEALPGAFGIMAKAVGVNEKELQNLMKSGDLIASEVLPKFAKQLEKTYGIENITRIESLTAAQSRYENAWTNFVRSLDDNDNKLSKFFSKSLGVLTDLMIGTTRLFESEEKTRQNTLNGLRQKGYKETLDYYNGLDVISKTDLQNDKKYNLEKIAEQTKEFERLKGRNLILKALVADTPLGKVESRENEAERIANSQKMKQINNLISLYGGQVSAVNSLLQAEVKEKETAKELTDEQIKAEEDRLKALYESNKKEIELRLLKQEVILNGEYTTYEEQYKALANANALRLMLIKLDNDEQIRLAKGNASKLKSANLDMQMAIIKQSEDLAIKLKSIRKKENDDRIKEINDIEAFLKKYHEDKDEQVEISLEIERKANKASNDLVDKKIEKLNELKQATSDYLNSFTSEFANNSGFGQTFDMFFDLDEKGKSMFDNLLAGAENSKQEFGVYFNSIAESAQEAFNFISSISQASFEEENKRIQSQYDTALIYAGENKEAQEKLANDLEKKKKEIANREAKAKKQQAIFNIAIDTAQAIVSLWVKPGFPAAIPLAIGVGALGLAQIAAVASQSIPQYAEGGTHDGGLMMVNDGKGSNYKETVVTPDGKVIKPQGRNVIMDAPAGTEIFTHDMWQDQLTDMLQGKGISMSTSNQYNGITKSDLEDVMMRSIANQTQYHGEWNAKGYNEYIKKGNNVTRGNIMRGNAKGLKF